jgi:hypothetical protein
MQLRLRDSLSCLTLALIPWLSACPSSSDGDGEEEVGETATTDETSETAGTSDESGNDQGSSETATEDTGTETGMETGMETGTEETGTEETGTEETGTEETDTGTTGDPSLNEELCMEGCAVFAECLGGGGLPGCYDSCLEHHDSLEGECLGYEQALTSCIIGLTCDELDQFLESSPEPYPCQAEEALICQEQVCEVGVGMGEDPGECSFEYSCPEEPLYEVVCDGSDCACFEAGVEVGGCSGAVEFCADVGEVEPANDCCGWDL